MNKNLKTILKFREERNWLQFHQPKNMAISLVLEATEFLELFQWTKDGKLPKEKIQEAADELADVYYWVLLMSHDLGINLEKSLTEKMKKNAKKYPIEISRGNSLKKYLKNIKKKS